MSPIVLSAGSARVVVLPQHGARMASLTIDGLELLARSSDDPIGWGAYPMAPWAGRLRDDGFSFRGQWHGMPANHEGRAVHGLVLGATFMVVDRSASHVVLAAPLGSPWPWSGRVVLAYRLRRNDLSVELSVQAQDAEFPAAVGLHPWLRRNVAGSGDVQIALGDSIMLERADAHRLTGRRVAPSPGPWDDAFEVPSRRVAVTWPGALTLAVESSSPWFVVFTERANAVCVEPQSAPPDALNDPLGDGVDVATSKQPVVLTTTWTW